jgi:7-cyano-7-deazaguanine synthase
MRADETDKETARALVLFSGGQDSAVCLAWTLGRFDVVETLGFDYGQRHRIELEARMKLLRALRDAFPDWAKKLGEDHLLELPALNIVSDTALTREIEITIGRQGLPTSFVPGRNLLFVTYAAALGYRRGIWHLIGGMCETDYSGYPDCRRETLDALMKAINLGMISGLDSEFILHTPLMHRDKADTWAMAEELGGETLLDLIVEHSHSCYLGERGNRHDWGYGCGSCPACLLRAAGYERYLEQKIARPSPAHARL